MSTGAGGGSLAPRALRLSISHSRPYTAESRGKYKGKVILEENEGEGKEEEKDVSTRDVGTQTDPDDQHFPPLHFSRISSTPLLKDDTIEHDQGKGNGPHVILPHSTNDYDHTPTKLRPESTTNAHPGTGVETVSEVMEHGKIRQRSLSVDAGIPAAVPRATQSARRFSDLYSFSRSQVQRQFHQQYPEQAPDIREYGIQTGRRHVIHGYHAYYFH